MSEPHQRVKSGKLVKPPRHNLLYGLGTNTSQHKDLKFGIENSTNLSFDDPRMEFENFLQSPTTLTPLHVLILQKLQRGFGAVDTIGIDSNLRRTWNIGAWKVENKIYISSCIVQPNIALCWTDVENIDKEVVEAYAAKFEKLSLPKSSCVVTGKKCTKVQGRWCLNLVQDLLDEEIVSESQVKITGLNIANSKIFFWMKLCTGSEYLCTLTLESMDVLIKYLPDWCISLREVNSTNYSIKIKDPEIANDASQISINKAGFMQYTGKPDNIERLCQCVTIGINEVMKSKYMRLFLQKLQYEVYNPTD